MLCLNSRLMYENVLTIHFWNPISSNPTYSPPYTPPTYIYTPHPSYPNNSKYTFISLDKQTRAFIKHCIMRSKPNLCSCPQNTNFLNTYEVSRYILLAPAPPSTFKKVHTSALSHGATKEIHFFGNWVLIEVYTLNADIIRFCPAIFVRSYAPVSLGFPSCVAHVWIWNDDQVFDK